MDPNKVARDVGGAKKRKSHDVVPMQVGQEHVEALLGRRAVLGHHMVAEFAHPRAEVADNVLVAAGNELYTAGVTAEGATHGKRQPAVYESVDRRIGLKRLPTR